MPTKVHGDHSHVFVAIPDRAKPEVVIQCQLCGANLSGYAYDPTEANEFILTQVLRIAEHMGIDLRMNREYFLNDLAAARPPVPEQEFTAEMAVNYMRVHREHVYLVANYLRTVANELMNRATTHDDSKWQEPEFTPYARALPAFAQAEYGTPEYKAVCDAIAPAIRHHVTSNSHHPEFYEDGVDGMNLFDVVEMLCDWMAACQRGNENATSHLRLDLQQERFHLSDQLLRIFINTVQFIDHRFQPTAPNVLSIEGADLP